MEVNDSPAESQIEYSNNYKLTSQWHTWADKTLQHIIKAKSLKFLLVYNRLLGTMQFLTA